MNTATQNLENDHEYILKLIDVMECITTTPDPKVEDLENVVDLIKNYADGLHHAKEENMLFPKMAEKGFSPEQGPVAVMLHEHVQGREYVKGMGDNILAYKSGNQLAVNLIYQNMDGYGELLRNHISKENNVLFRMADNVLSADEQQALLERFAQVEKSSTPTEFKNRIEALARAYNV